MLPHCVCVAVGEVRGKVMSVNAIGPVVSRSAVKRPRSAWRMHEKSAAATPVRTWAARTIRCSRSSTCMISLARIALNCSASALFRPRSRNTLPLPCTISSFSLALSKHLLQVLQSVPKSVRCRVWVQGTKKPMEPSEFIIDGSIGLSTVLGRGLTAVDPFYRRRQPRPLIQGSPRRM